jgi:predicted alpha/beta-fold hydrolase
MTQVGFSLGANITLKLAGEDASQPTGNLDSIVAVSAPVDLAATARHLCKSKHKLFDQFFVWKLKYDIMRHHRRFPELPPPEFPLTMTLTDLDELYTAPRSGFKNAQDYYSKSSSGSWVSSIRIRGLILCAQDDPIIDAQTYLKLDIPPQIDLIMTAEGGHVGFIGETAQAADFQWMDSLISQWARSLSQTSPISLL